MFQAHLKHKLLHADAEAANSAVFPALPGKRCRLTFRERKLQSLSKQRHFLKVYLTWFQDVSFCRKSLHAKVSLLPQIVSFSSKLFIFKASLEPNGQLNVFV